MEIILYLIIWVSLGGLFALLLLTNDPYVKAQKFARATAEKIEILKHHNEGDEIEVSFNLYSREFNGKYFHNIDAWRIESLANTEANQMQEAPEFDTPANEDDDLPF